MITIPEFITPSSAAEARKIQEELRERVNLQNEFGIVSVIAGIDVGLDLETNRAHAAIVTLSMDRLEVIEQVQAFAPADFPYIPGLLSFREIPAILAAIAKLSRLPDMFMVDGQGIAHPRRLGIASHIGVLLDMPTIGVGKSKLIGQFEMPGEKKGEQAPLTDKGDRIGTVLRSRDNVAPLFVSPGHRVDLETSVGMTMRCLTKYRLPEPTRLADKFSKMKNSLILDVEA